jgi:hypothetical protein
MRDIWQTHTHIIAVLVLIFILITSVVDEYSPLAVSRLTAMCVALYKISIPDAGGSQPFIRELSGVDTPAPLKEEECAKTKYGNSPLHRRSCLR